MAIPSENILFDSLVTPGTPLVGASTAAAASQAATITAGAGLTAYVSGFFIGGLGATAAGGVTATLSDGTLSFNIPVPVVSGVSNSNTSINYSFQYPFPASGTGKTWTLTLPSYGSGNTLASCSVFGFSL